MGSVTLGLMGLGQLVALVSHFRSSMRVGVVVALYLYLFAGRYPNSEPLSESVHEGIDVDLTFGITRLQG